MLTSVRSHIPSWLGGNKAAAPAAATDVKDEGTTVLPQAADDLSPSRGDIGGDKESDDASSATGGADSDNQVKTFVIGLFFFS